MIYLPEERPFCLIIQGDCLDVLPLLPKGRVGLTIIDPAYESLERHRAKGTTTRLKQSNASSNQWFSTFPNSLYPKLFEQLWAVHAKNTHCYMFCDGETEHILLSGTNPYHQPAQGAYQPIPVCTKWHAWPSLTWLKTKQGLTWKTIAGRLASLAVSEADTTEVAVHLTEQLISIGMGYHWRRATEQILFLEKGKRKLKQLGWGSALAGPKTPRKDAYPTQKPQCVLERLVRNSSDKGDVVLDCFAGSGSTGLAALKHGRSCILIDRTTEWLLEQTRWPAGAHVQHLRVEHTP